MKAVYDYKTKSDLFFILGTDEEVNNHVQEMTDQEKKKILMLCFTAESFLCSFRDLNL